MPSWWSKKLVKLQVGEMASWWNFKLVKLQVGETSSWWNFKLVKLQVGEMASWWNFKLVKWQIGETSSWWNFKLVKLQVGETSSWRNFKLVKWQVGETLSCWNGKLLKGQVDETTQHQSWAQIFSRKSLFNFSFAPRDEKKSKLEKLNPPTFLEQLFFSLQIYFQKLHLRSPNFVAKFGENKCRRRRSYSENYHLSEKVSLKRYTNFIHQFRNIKWDKLQ